MVVLGPSAKPIGEKEELEMDENVYVCVFLVERMRSMGDISLGKEWTIQHKVKEKK